MGIVTGARGAPLFSRSQATNLSSIWASAQQERLTLVCPESVT
jgi:hypothetical protein